MQYVVMAHEATGFDMNSGQADRPIFASSDREVAERERVRLTGERHWGTHFSVYPVPDEHDAPVAYSNRYVG